MDKKSIRHHLFVTSTNWAKEYGNHKMPINKFALFVFRMMSTNIWMGILFLILEKYPFCLYS